MVQRVTYRPSLHSPNALRGVFSLSRKLAFKTMFRETQGLRSRDEKDFTAYCSGTMAPQQVLGIDLVTRCRMYNPC